MSLFKKKKKMPAILSLLNAYYNKAQENNKKYFYCLVDENEKSYAEKFCIEHHLNMFVDYINNGNLVYKFIILGE